MRSAQPQKLSCVNSIVLSFLFSFHRPLSKFLFVIHCIAPFYYCNLGGGNFCLSLLLHKIISPLFCVSARWCWSLLDLSVLPSVFMANKMSLPSKNCYKNFRVLEFLVYCGLSCAFHFLSYQNFWWLHAGYSDITCLVTDCFNTLNSVFPSDVRWRVWC